MVTYKMVTFGRRSGEHFRTPYPTFGPETPHANAVVVEGGRVRGCPVGLIVCPVVPAEGGRQESSRFPDERALVLQVVESYPVLGRSHQLRNLQELHL